MLSSLTVTDLLARYDTEILPQKALTTQYQQRHVHAWLVRELGDLRLCDLTPMLLRTWRTSLERRLAPGTVRRYLDSLSGPLTAAVQEWGWLPENPLRKVRKPPSGPGRVRFLSADERQRLLAACQQSRNPALYPFVLLALVTGARKTELRTLRWEHVDLVRGQLRFLHTKNGERRGVPVAQMALEVLRAWHALRGASAWVFPRADGRAPVDLDSAWQGAIGRAGIADFHMHDFRHSCASYLAMSGASLLEIAEVLGHKTLAMVRRYSHLTENHTKSVVERMAQQFLHDEGRSRNREVIVLHAIFTLL